MLGEEEKSAPEKCTKKVKIFAPFRVQKLSVYQIFIIACFIILFAFVLVMKIIKNVRKLIITKLKFDRIVEIEKQGLIKLFFQKVYLFQKKRFGYSPSQLYKILTSLIAQL